MALTTEAGLDPRTERRIDELLARMSRAQKIGQMTQPERLHATPDDVRAYHIGSILSGGGSTPGENRLEDWVAMNDAYWAASMDDADGHVPIPLLYGVDAIHGHNNVLGATVFPHNIGLGAASDPELMARIARVTAKEVLATGVEWTFAPTLAVVRDIRWGRTYESFGSSPDIVAACVAPFVRALQGDLGDDAVIACAKHWIGDGGTTDGVDQGDTEISERELREVHLPPYLAALEAGALTVMASYNSWNGEKCHGHRYLLTDVLKGELGFDGLVVSDWDGIDQLADDYEEAVARSVNAGIDLFMVPLKWKRFIESLDRLVGSGRVPEERIDDAVRRILRVKLAYGLFDRPRPAARPWSGHASFGSAEHRAVAREAVRKSLVLLKNEDDALPLRRDARILVAGKNANDRGHQCGGFTVEWQGVSGNERIVGGTSIWEGISAAAPGAVLVEDVGELDGGAGDPAAAGPGSSGFDVAVVVLGETPYAEGLGDLRSADTPAAEVVAPGSSHRIRLEPYGDSLELAVTHPEDLAALRAVAALGIPIVTVLVSGRPLVVTPELELSDAFVAAWLPGSEGGGVADVLFGEHDFQGRLSFAWPDDASDPLFDPGYGLSMSLSSGADR